ncbi:MAG: hypothetical protein GXY34_03645, partial [Syntrophomonadaceae bacterium]|nr:hypothetical protein [Syntrophomonadaceae bacterium]
PIPQAETSAVLSSSPLPETSLSPEATVEPTPTVAPVLDFPIVRDEIVTALLMYTYPMLEDYMADTVEVRIEGDTCCGVLPKEQVYANLEPYLQTFTGMWDFSDNEIDAGLRAQYPEHYATAIIGLMENEQAIGIVLNGEGKISKISMIQNYNNLLE